jgi:hypothetical protein
MGPNRRCHCASTATTHTPQATTQPAIRAT